MVQFNSCLGSFQPGARELQTLAELKSLNLTLTAVILTAVKVIAVDLDGDPLSLFDLPRLPDNCDQLS